MPGNMIDAQDFNGIGFRIIDDHIITVRWPESDGFTRQIITLLSHVWSLSEIEECMIKQLAHVLAGRKIFLSNAAQYAAQITLRTRSYLVILTHAVALVR